MRAVEIKEAGPPETLALTTRPVPTPKAGEVLIKVAAAGVNRPDVLQRQGKYPPPPGASDLPGLEVAGTIVKLGEGATGWQVADRVCALLTGGGYAEYVAVPAAQCLPVPKGLTLVEAASLPETFFTVWHNVFERGQLKPGESFLVQGGTSGIGVTAIQMVKAFGNRVFATAGSDEKCGACVKLGADRAINYKTEDFVDVLQKETAGRGVDVILDMVGGDYIPRELKALAPDGRLVLIAFLGGAKATVNFADVMMRRLTITGSTLRARPVEVKASIAQALREKVWPLIEAGKIRPVVHATFPLAEAAKAHALMESSTHVGKIMLTVEA
ncbi:MAG: NAD(P)H-quinone oxidoreductase [Azospira oryzae]|nr:MAG: NAD(P)H-quinone oxidoreductase [Azospira oryzae]PZP81564.1 MAG: NAD(P)H-quinone oxidoreductase [Azospira oryzae]